MKRLPLAIAAAVMLLASGCASFSNRPLAVGTEDAAAEVSHRPAPADGVAIRDAEGDTVVQKVEFRSGVSSATVERLGKRFGCGSGSGKGAGLLTAPGPVEVYRMQCDNGTTFLAQCELRQCRPMR